MKKVKKLKSMRISLGISLLYALGGAGCGIDKPPASFNEMPRAFVYLTVEDNLEDELFNSEDAVWNDSVLKDDMIDQILAKFNQETDQDYLPPHSETSNTSDSNNNLDQFSDYQAPVKGPTTPGDIKISELDLKACAGLHGVPVQQIVVAGNKNQNTIRTNSVVAAKIAGNQTQLDLHLDSATPTTLRGVCIFATGHQSSVQVTVQNIILESAFLIGRGRQTQIRMLFIESYTPFLLVDLAGSQPIAYVEGLPDRNCPEVTVKLRGNQPRFFCD